MIDGADLITRVCRLMPEWLGEELSEFEYLPAGYSNDNYKFRRRGEHFVVRLPTGPRDPAGWRRERGFYQSPGNIVVPEIVAFDVDAGAMISRWIKGPLMVDAAPSHDRLVSYLKDLHNNLAATQRTYDPIARSLKDLATPGPGQPPSSIARLASASRWPPAHLSACHNDFNPWNVICAPNGWVTLDWESYGNNDPLFDLVTMHQGLNLDDDVLPDLCDELLDAVVAPGRIEQVVIGFWVREYAWAFAESQRGNSRAELGEQMLRADEKLSALGS
ncbi:MAG: phosphotransferase [Gammaproteobacteria bacterium]|nr:phosphotransferase [Gammaproteobacteria bacterium]